MPMIRYGNTGPKSCGEGAPVAATFRVGDKIRFYEERLSYTIQAISVSGRWMACTKPFRVYGPTAVIYTMVDTVEGLRGVDDSMGNSLGYETREDCERSVELFERGEFEFSGRRRPIPAILFNGERLGTQATTEPSTGAEPR
jgi:hypothetical protein